MPTRSVHLSDHFDRFIVAGVASGQFSDADEVVREGLKLLEQHQAEDHAKIAWLRSAAQEGFDAVLQGDYTSLDTPEDISSIMADIHLDVLSERITEPQGV